MDAEDARPGRGVSLPSPEYLEALSEQIGVVHGELHRDWLWIRFLAAVILGLGVWIVVQQVGLDSTQDALNGKTAQIASLEQQTAQLARHNAATEAADKQKARALCLQLNKTRDEIFPAWRKVLSSRPDWKVLLPGVASAEELGACPEGPAAGH